MAENVKQKPSERLVSTLGFDPTRRDKITNDVVAKALEKIKAERAVEAEARAEATVRQLLELAQKHEKVRKDFRKADEEIEKMIGKQLADLNPAQQNQQQGEQSTEEKVEEVPAVQS